MTDAVPVVRGGRWPAEWEPHEATIMAWPHDPTTWPDCLDDAEVAFAQLAAAISQGETVHLLVGDEAMKARASKRLEATNAKDVVFHAIATADAWLRDTGPVIVHDGNERVALDFRFNAWGEKYEELLVDDGLPVPLAKMLGLERRRVPIVLEGGSIEGNGEGVLLTTEQCLLNPNRNPELTREDLEAVLNEALGASPVLWLQDGIAGDDTDGHVDDITRFVGPRNILTALPEDPQDPDFEPLFENLRRLKDMRNAQGGSFAIVRIPMPEPIASINGGHRLPASYMNFYICNAAVCVPVFGQPRDEEALRVVARCFRDRKIVPIRCERVVEGMGALHCVTQQVPA